MVKLDLFGNQCPVYEEDRIWIENSFLWLIENYGLRKLRAQKLVFINENHFPSLYKKEDISIDGCLHDLRIILEVDQQIPISIRAIKDNRKASELKIGEVDHKKNYTIQLSEVQLKNINQTILLICVELVKVKLIEAGIPIHKENDSELFLFIAMTFFGFGIIISNHTDLLSNEEIPKEIQSYCLAMFFWVRNENQPTQGIINELDLSLRNLLKKSLRYLNSKRSQLSMNNVEQMDWSNEQLRDAWNFYNDGHYDLAISVGKEALRTNESNIYLMNSLAEFLLRKREYKEALQLLEKALKIDSNFSMTHNNIGFARLMMENTTQALRHIKKAIALDKSNAIAHRNLAIYHTQTKNFEQAFKYFDRASKINPNIELLHYYKGMAYLENSNKKAAIIEFEKSSESGEQEAIKMLEDIQGYKWQPRN